MIGFLGLFRGSGMQVLCTNLSLFRPSLWNHCWPCWYSGLFSLDSVSFISLHTLLSAVRPHRCYEIGYKYSTFLGCSTHNWLPGRPNLWKVPGICNVEVDAWDHFFCVSLCRHCWIYRDWSRLVSALNVLHENLGTIFVTLVWACTYNGSFTVLM